MAIKLEKNQKGAIGEHLVAAKLLEHGWNVFMANHSIKNLKGMNEPATKNHISFNNPLKGVSSQDNWDRLF